MFGGLGIYSRLARSRFRCFLYNVNLLILRGSLPSLEGVGDAFFKAKSGFCSGFGSSGFGVGATAFLNTTAGFCSCFGSAVVVAGGGLCGAVGKALVTAGSGTVLVVEVAGKFLLGSDEPFVGASGTGLFTIGSGEVVFTVGSGFGSAGVAFFSANIGAFSSSFFSCFISKCKIVKYYLPVLEELV
jgi:hypothetical protein